MNNIGRTIARLRADLKLSQEEFASIFGVSKQSAQKWERGESTPDLNKLIQISKKFNISLDALVLDSNARLSGETSKKCVSPHYESVSGHETYSAYLMTEYTQSYEEGKDIKPYKDLFSAAAGLPRGEIKEKISETLYEAALNCPQRSDFGYTEPSDLEGIRLLRKKHPVGSDYEAEGLLEKIHGAWIGRICGCMLGKSVEGIRTGELVPFLKETGNYPMNRYILSTDLNEAVCSKYSYPLASRPYADKLKSMIPDDDTNYVVMAQLLIDRFGRDFTPYNVSQLWISSQSKNAYFTAERAAYRNFINGFQPPESAIYKNPFREWIGAQIRGDYFGYINPGDPEKAAEMAFRDASISHVKNGIYGEMFASAAIAAAAVTNDIEDILLAGLAEVPYTSRFYEEIMSVVSGFRNGVSCGDAFDAIHKKYDEYTEHGWCHVLPNAMIVAASLLYGGGDFGKSVCLAVQTGFDTDCNGATVGSILGMANGFQSIPEYWYRPFNDRLETSIFGVGTVSILECARHTLEHIPSKA